MLLELPYLWIALLNVVCIPLIHLGVSWLFTKMPRRWFSKDQWWSVEYSFEDGGRFWERFAGVKRWKHWLPDGGPWLGGFSKKNLKSRDPGFFRTFVSETRRGEAAHIAQFFALLLLLAWNPWPASAVIVGYAALSNLPCILLQRHTRARMQRILRKF